MDSSALLVVLDTLEVMTVEGCLEPTVDLALS